VPLGLAIAGLLEAICRAELGGSCHDTGVDYRCVPGVHRELTVIEKALEAER
jgi:hypothetical protein